MAFPSSLAPVAPIAGDDVHVWTVDLLADTGPIAAFAATLSADERDRAARFYFERDRRRYIVARGALRTILGECLGVDAAAVEFQYGAHGKPSLAADLAFNVSHSGELALIACSRRGEIGVDIEEIRLLTDADLVASQFFSPREVARLRALPLGMRNEAFFRCWTRKEAYVKALGEGLSRPLATFDVTFTAGEPAMLTVDHDEQETKRWSLTALDTPRGYAAALVTEGQRRVIGRRYAPDADLVGETV